MGSFTSFCISTTHLLPVFRMISKRGLVVVVTLLVWTASGSADVEHPATSGLSFMKACYPGLYNAAKSVNSGDSWLATAQQMASAYTNYDDEGRQDKLGSVVSALTTILPSVCSWLPFSRTSSALVGASV